MRTPIDEQLLEEISKYTLRYSCEACGHFDATLGDCSLGYPNGSHRHRPLVGGAQLIFCKEFDLV